MNTTVPELETTTPRRSLRPRARWILVLGLAALFGLWVGAQYLGYRFAYHPNLGPTLFETPAHLRAYCIFAACACLAAALFLLVRRSNRAWAIPSIAAAGGLGAASLGPLESPFHFLRWASVYGHVPELAPIVSDGILLVAVSTLAAAISMLVVLGRRPHRTASSSHGTARWGSGEVLRGPDGLGLLIGRSRHSGELLRFNGEGHLLTLAPTRSGRERALERNGTRVSRGSGLHVKANAAPKTSTSCTSAGWRRSGEAPPGPPGRSRSSSPACSTAGPWTG